MDFRTEVTPTPPLIKSSLKNSFFTIGSCFADAMGSRLSDFKFHVAVNPFGTVYNPISIHKLLVLATQNGVLPEKSFLQNNDLHANYHFHSQFSSLQKNELKSQIQSTVSLVHQHLKNTKVVILTYGTAWVYRRKDTNEVVANCHKMSPGLFTKSLLSQRAIVEDFHTMRSVLSEVNPSIRFILTVSPVRHIKDTLELNSVSKAILRSACYELVQSNSDITYFPAYEIMMDDLRDYRFYKSDMLHPSAEAEEYIWQKFVDCYFNEATQQFLTKWKEIRSALAHKAFHPTSKEHQTFLKATLKKVMELTGVVDVEKEIESLQSQILD
jgi:hypothetical protein